MDMAQFSAFALYDLAKRLHSEGLYGDDFLAVEVAGEAYELRYMTHERDEVYFTFIPSGARYSRRTVFVCKDGSTGFDDEGVLPAFDRRENEKPITLSQEELMQIAFSALQAAA